MKHLPHRLSLVSQTTAALREELHSGSWAKWLPGEHELCAQLHISRVTLRAALSQLQREGWVRSSRGRRREIIRVPPRSSVTSSNHVILVMPSPVEYYHPLAMVWLDSLREQLAEAGYHLVTHVSRAAYSRQPARTLPVLMERLRPAAWVLTRSSEQMQRIFENRGAPCVIAGSPHPGVKLPSIDGDLQAACRHAVGRFITKGHRRLVFLNPESAAAGDKESEAGFYEGVVQSHKAGIEGRVVRHNGTVAGICRELDSLLRHSNPPTAFLVSSPSHVLTTMGYLMNRGLRLPHDVALISRDDDPLLEQMVPSVARYTMNLALYARKLSKVVLGLVRGEVVPATANKIVPSFIKGQTLG
jgi:DNA-binding LacI/PurR family transcriptional regulator